MFSLLFFFLPSKGSEDIQVFQVERSGGWGLLGCKFTTQKGDMGIHNGVKLQ